MMEKIKKALLWGIVVFMALAAIIYMPSLASLFMILFVAIVIPIQSIQGIWSSIKLKGLIKGLLAFVIFVIAIELTPTRSEIDKRAVDAPIDSTSSSVRQEAVAQPEEKEDYADITELFENICPDAKISSGRPSAQRIKITISTKLSAEKEPDGWNDIIVSLGNALSSAEKLTSKYNAETVAAEIDAEDGTILASGLQGAVKYNLFEKEPEPEPAPEATTDPEVTPAETPKPKKAPTEITYVLNTNTMKFHYPSCASVEDISTKNRSSYTGSRGDVISMGYDPCGRCNP